MYAEYFKTLTTQNPKITLTGWHYILYLVRFILHIAQCMMGSTRVTSLTTRRFLIREKEYNLFVTRRISFSKNIYVVILISFHVHKFKLLRYSCRDRKTPPEGSTSSSKPVPLAKGKMATLKTTQQRFNLFYSFHE